MPRTTRRAFYERFDFVPSPTDPCHMAILLKDLRARINTGNDLTELKYLSWRDRRWRFALV